MTDSEINPVLDFTASGFDAVAVSMGEEAQQQLENVQALKLSVCVGASYNPGTNKVCFKIPIYGNYCITSPVHIPVGGQLKVCAQTCGSIIPTGLKATIYLNSKAILTEVLFGSC